ncbi:glutamate 5-kinase [Stakelama saccharophila]|uniref:Glutamate 5-kinase n=1 Tax=Stakelama saccharophila TaxID=3075605 RepID=A0ABZ0BCY9_9SPHN|nr:glutamate 5-kinase [Stakelama sp. W311]WNO54931.1 glutamate 5-kinase [Stakelama sp. W311]
MNEADRFSPKNCPRLIVKVGSALLVDPDGELHREWLETLIDDVHERIKAGQEVAIVSSGSIAIGARRLGLPGGGRNSLEDAQASAATGQIALAHMWSELLHDRGLSAAQVLVTLGDMEDRRRYLNASATLGRLLGLGVVPVVNENDTVATERIRFGDNDRLAARVAQAANADGVILLSDVDGLYDSNPTHNPDAKLIPVIEEIDESITGMADSRSASGMGSGGMVSKIEAARIATTVGADLAIVSGKQMHALKAFEESGHGSVFVGSGNAGARKAWLAGGLTEEGTIIIDQGAVEALQNGNSLLPAGAIRIEGEFLRGDLVSIVDSKHNKIARGLAEYDYVDAQRIVGRRSEDIARILGYSPRSALVHRSHMAVL